MVVDELQNLFDQIIPTDLELLPAMFRESFTTQRQRSAFDFCRAERNMLLAE
jgi:hypothetical protein